MPTLVYLKLMTLKLMVKTVHIFILRLKKKGHFMLATRNYTFDRRASDLDRGLKTASVLQHLNQNPGLRTERSTDLQDSFRMSILRRDFRKLDGCFEMPWTMN